ncbi:MAG TPA: hypothetical protein VES20_14065 [Bryobacteraceae bacterium]|nr:hypothetical protein [Bryobacteraceae bacterium]
MSAGAKPESVDAAEMREQLDRILDSPHFKTSRRCSDFLRMVVEASAEGKAHTIKERTLGVAIFDRRPDYDTNQDPIVRNTAGQVRKRLAQYYYAPGHDLELRINLPPGSYVPEFAPAAIPAPAPAPEPPAEPPSPAAPLPRQTSPVAGRARLLIAAAAVLALAALIWSTVRHRRTALDEFWAPVVATAGPVTLCVGQGHTYKLTPEWDRYFDDSGLKGPASVPLGDVSPVFSRQVGLSDAQAAVRLAGLLARSRKEVVLRGGRSTSFSDLRGKPVVLIGAFNNEWTLRLMGELRFYFDLENGEYFVRDRHKPENHAWRVESDPENPQVEVDYAIVSRVHNATTEQTVVAGAGIKGGGTSASVEFLTNPGYLERALASAPARWGKRNAQFVLSTKVYAGAPGPPAVVAAHYW